MGYRNVRAAISGWSHLEHRAARCLLIMASVARDAPGPRGEAARVYYGGHEFLAWALGLTDWDQEPSQSDLRMVRKAVADLVAAGAVKPVNRPQPGVVAAYQLALGR